MHTYWAVLGANKKVADLETKNQRKMKMIAEQNSGKYS